MVQMVVKLGIIILFLFANCILVHSHDDDESSDLCNDKNKIISESENACQNLDTSNTGSCLTASTFIETIFEEPCKTEPTRYKRDKHGSKKCQYTYYSNFLNQTVCVGERLSKGLKNGDLQYKLGVELLAPCTLNGLQRCVGEYGFITCNEGNWTISQVCDAEQACKSEIQYVVVPLRDRFKSRGQNKQNHHLQKAKCAPLVLFASRFQWPGHIIK